MRVPRGNATADTGSGDLLDQTDSETSLLHWQTRVRRAWRGFTRVHNAALGLLGRLAGGVSGGHCGRTRGLRYCRGGFLSPHARGGTTIGNTYFTSSTGDIGQRRMRHERRHAQQWRTWGPLFPFLYFASGLDPCHNTWERRAGHRDGGYRC